DFSILDSFGTYHRSAARVLDALLASVRKTVSARDIAVAAAASVENPLDKTKNLADVADVDVARANLGIDGISKHIGTGDLADGAARLNLQTHLLPLTNIFFHPTQEYKTSTTINLQDGAAYWFLLVGGGGAGGKGNTPYFHAGGGGGGAGGLSIYAFPIDATRKKAVIEIGTGGATTPAVRGPHSPGGETIVKLVDPVSGRTTEILKAGGGQQGHESLRKSTGNTNAKGGIGGKGYGNIFGIDGERGWDSLLGGPATSSGNPGGKGYFSKWFINTYNRNVVNGVNHHRGFGSGGDGMYSLTLPNNYYDWSPNVQGYHGVVRIWKQK
ncbi:MAG: glycine-rich domain-containing protein, partial [Pseudomonadota bacterium]